MLSETIYLGHLRSTKHHDEPKYISNLYDKVLIYQNNYEKSAIKNQLVMLSNLESYILH